MNGRGDDLLEDNLKKYPPFEDDWMHKLIQMEENIFLHWLTVDPSMVISKIH